MNGYTVKSLDCSEHLGSTVAVDGRVETEVKVGVNEAGRSQPCIGLVLELLDAA